MRILLNSFIAVLMIFCCASVGISWGEQEIPSRHRSHSEKPKTQRPDLTVVGNVRLADGIGRQSVDLMQSLQGSATISFLATASVPKEELNACSLTLQKILTTSGAKYPGRVLVYEDLLSWKPSNTIPQRKFWSRFKVPEKTKEQIRFAYTMFESSRAPQAWVHILNQSFDAVLVPDEFLVKVYKDSGVMIPIFVIPLGRDLKAFLDAPLKSSRGSPLIFANYSTCFPRKNLLSLVRAFGDAFGNNPDVQLQLCWRQYDAGTRNAIFSEVVARGLTNVSIEEQPVDDAAYLQRFLSADCYVNIATGEGFSNQPREAMALGIPVIVTDNTGQKTICASGLVRAVPSDVEVPALYTFPGDFGVQYQCLTSDVAAAFRDVYSHYERYLQNAKKARQWAGQYHYTKMVPLYMSLIKPKKVVLGAEDRIVQNGIVTTSKKLVRKYKKVLASR
jgi:glycosyltransferase involved in cell wall biosynthesis